MTFQPRAQTIADEGIKAGERGYMGDAYNGEQPQLVRLVLAVDRAIRGSTNVTRRSAHLYDECACGKPKAKIAEQCWRCHSS